MDLMENVGNMQEQMGDINGETEIIRAKILTIKSIVTKIKDVFDGLMSTFL